MSSSIYATFAFDPRFLQKLVGWLDFNMYVDDQPTDQGSKTNYILTATACGACIIYMRPKA